MSQKKYYTHFVVFMLICAMSAISNSCQKVNDTIDNNQVLETPYTLYFGDSYGVLYNTNDGIKIKNVPFPADGTGFRAICTSKDILLFIKMNLSLYFSFDNGKFIKHTYDSLRIDSGVASNGVSFYLNNSMIIDIPKWNRVFVVSCDNTALDYFGLFYSNKNGQWGSWCKDTAFKSDSIKTALPITVTSLTFTKGNILFGWDALHQKSVYRTDTLDTTPFWETTSTTNPLPTTGFFTVGHYNNEIIAVDNRGIEGGYYSDNLGRDWLPFQGLPSNVPLLCVNSPFEEVCFVGTGGSGIYVMNANTHAFQPCNNGLASNTIVRGIAGKESIYKNGTVKKVVFIATNNGVYKSTDNGNNWILVTAGNFTAIY